MKIDKISNGYIIEYDEEIKDSSDFNVYKYHKYAFLDWDGVVAFVSKNESLINA